MLESAAFASIVLTILLLGRLDVIALYLEIAGFDAW